MLSMSILTRTAFLGMMLAGLVSLTDGMARAQLNAAVDDFTADRTRVVVQITGTVD